MPERGIYIKIYIIFYRTWRDDQLSGVHRQSKPASGLPSKQIVSQEYDRCSANVINIAVILAFLDMIICESILVQVSLKGGLMEGLMVCVFDFFYLP